MDKMNKHYGTGTKGISPELWDTLYLCDWPGNVRELIQAIEHALILAKPEPTLFPKHLPKHIRIQVARSEVTKKRLPQPGLKGLKKVPAGLPSLQEVRESALEEAERGYLKELMEQTRGSIKNATKVSGLSRSRLYTLLKKYSIPPKP